MKHIIYKTVTIHDPRNNQEAKFNYREGLHIAIHHPLDGKDLGIDEIRKGIRLLDAIEKGDDTGFNVEDADFEFLMKKLNALHFQWADRAFVQFVDDIAGSAAQEKKK
jgi:hypothetical protein